MDYSIDINDEYVYCDDIDINSVTPSFKCLKNLKLFSYTDYYGNICTIDLLEYTIIPPLTTLFIKNNMIIPSCCKRLTILSGNINKYKIPDFIEYFDCSCLNTIQELEIPLSIKELHCDYNPIKNIILPKDIEIVYCSHCQLETISINENLTNLIILDLQCNNLNVIDFKLPKTLTILNIWNNNNIKLKYLDFIFKDNMNYLCGGDYFETLNPGYGDVPFDYTLSKIYKYVLDGQEYIDITRFN